MTTSGRVAIAAGCTVAGIVLTWAVQHPGRTTMPRRDAIAAPAVGRAPLSGGPVLWLLAVGVSHYQNPEFNLQFAADDARAVAEMLGRQSQGAVYSQTHTQVLIDADATRESILDALERFAAQATPDDVAVVFVAGHGVQDLATGSYYFLTYPATADNVLTTGLRMSDLDEMIRALRRNVRAVVVMIDTCHAGALRLPAGGLVSTDELGSHLSAGEGFFLLAATKPGEESKEKPELGHGAFTYALLEGLQGAADSDGDGVLSVSELFGYVARQVPRLTDDTQHAYDKIEGTDLMFAASLGEISASNRVVTPVTASAGSGTGVATAPLANTIGVMPFRNLRSDPEHDWVGTALRVALNTELSKVRALHVYSPELIDRTARARGTDNLYVAQQLAISKLLTGSFSVVGDMIRIDAQIIDASTGLQEGSDSVQGNFGDFFELQKTLVISMLRRLPVDVSPEEGTSIRKETNTDVDAYRLLLETEGIVAEPTKRLPKATQGQGSGPHSRLEGWNVPGLARIAYAAAPDPETDAAVRALLQDYREALEHKDLDRLAALYVSFSPQQRSALRDYLQNAIDFSVEVSDVTVVPHERDVAVAYTRRDHFVDRESGKTVRLEVRLTKIVVREGGKWKIAGGQ
jgi:TolB-like protein/ketosteroid isomerase-like protein